MKFIGARKCCGRCRKRSGKRTCQEPKPSPCSQKSKAMAIASVIGKKHRTVQGELRKIRILTPIYTTA